MINFDKLQNKLDNSLKNETPESLQEWLDSKKVGTIKAHKFNLKVEYSDGIKWDLNILALDASWVWLFVNQERKHLITFINIQLVKENAAEVKDNGFGAIAYNADDTLPLPQKNIVKIAD